MTVCSFDPSAENARLRLAAIVDSSNDAIISKNLDGVISTWNLAAQQLFGYSEAEAIGQPITLIIPADLHDEEKDLLRRVRVGERIEHYETHRVTRDGRTLDVSITISPVRDATGTIVGASKILRDVTAGRRAQAALRESERRLASEAAAARTLQSISTRLISESTQHSLFAQIIDAAMVLMASDASSIQILSPAGDSLTLLGWRMFHPDSAAFWQRVTADAGSTCGVALRDHVRVMVTDVESCEFMAGTQDLEEYRRSGIRAVQSTPLCSRVGVPLGMISTHWHAPHTPTEDDFRLFDVLARQAADLIERTRAEESLRESEERFHLSGNLTGPTDDARRAQAAAAHATNGDLDFHRLVADVASRFVAIDAEGIDGAIIDGIRRIGEALTLDRATLWMREPGESMAVPTHYWERPAGGSPPAPVPVAAIPFVTARLHAGEVNWFSNLDEVPDPIDRETFRSRGLKAAAWVRLTSPNDPEDKLTVLTFSSTAHDYEWTPPMIGRLSLVAGVIGQALARRASQQALQRAFVEIDQLRDRMSSENVERRRDKKTVHSPTVVAHSPAMRQVLVQVAQVAPTPATVLLLGETGTGKEVIAQAIHDASPRHQRPMVRVSCAAIPAQLIESELFGRERGAFTGALSRQIGRFEAANHSTLFLDEIGELSTEVQVKLLRVLQERVIERLGSTQPIKVDVRIIAATNRNLETAVRDRTFREDLYYRLNVFPIEIPPLRERVDDIPTLVASFIDEFSRTFGKPIDPISQESMRQLQGHPWPGNVRELRNIIERAVIVARGRTLVVSAPRTAQQILPYAAMTLAEVEVEHIRAVLKSTNWRIRGAAGAAERLGMKPTTLETRMVKHGLSRKQTERGATQQQPSDFLTTRIRRGSEDPALN